MENETRRFFVCERSDGCRLSDLNLNLVNGQKFERDTQITETSRSINAAIRIGWIREITEKEYKAIK
jgi:hypothetical protein